jgi:hypothetical protein
LEEDAERVGTMSQVSPISAGVKGLVAPFASYGKTGPSAGHDERFHHTDSSLFLVVGQFAEM